jgi:hypothetical protein
VGTGASRLASVSRKDTSVCDAIHPHNFKVDAKSQYLVAIHNFLLQLLLQKLIVKGKKVPKGRKMQQILLPLVQNAKFAFLG